MNHSQSVKNIRSIKTPAKKINNTTKERNVNSSRTETNCNCVSTVGKETSNKDCAIINWPNQVDSRGE